MPELKPLEGPRKLCTAGADEAGRFVGCLIAGEGDKEWPGLLLSILLPHLRLPLNACCGSCGCCCGCSFS